MKAAGEVLPPSKVPHRPDDAPAPGLRARVRLPHCNAGRLAVGEMNHGVYFLAPRSGLPSRTPPAPAPPRKNSPPPLVPFTTAGSPGGPYRADGPERDNAARRHRPRRRPAVAARG